MACMMHYMTEAVQDGNWCVANLRLQKGRAKGKPSDEAEGSREGAKILTAARAFLVFLSCASSCGQSCSLLLVEEGKMKDRRNFGFLVLMGLRKLWPLPRPNE